jgi:hypothetical protein
MAMRDGIRCWTWAQARIIGRDIYGMLAPVSRSGCSPRSPVHDIPSMSFVAVDTAEQLEELNLAGGPASPPSVHADANEQLQAPKAAKKKRKKRSTATDKAGGSVPSADANNVLISRSKVRTEHSSQSKLMARTASQVHQRLSCVTQCPC